MKNNTVSSRVISNINQQRIFIMLIGVSVLFSILIPRFISTENIINILSYTSLEGIILIGMTYLIIIGEIDLSIGAIMSISGTFAVLFQKYGVIAGISMGLAVGIIIGLVNGLIVVKCHVDSMPATLGVMVLVNSLVYVLTGSTSIWGSNSKFALIANVSILGIPIVVFLLILLVILFDLILRKTRFGRNIYAIGGNIHAAKYAGIKTDRVRIISFMLTGLLAGLAGVLVVSKYNVASGLIGSNTALMVITAVLLGGVSLSGGDGSVIKSFIGLLLVSVLSIGMQFLKFPVSVQPMVVGGVLIASLALEAMDRQREQYK